MFIASARLQFVTERGFVQNNINNYRQSNGYKYTYIEVRIAEKFSQPERRRTRIGNGGFYQITRFTATRVD